MTAEPRACTGIGLFREPFLLVLLTKKDGLTGPSANEPSLGGSVSSFIVDIAAISLFMLTATLLFVRRKTTFFKQCFSWTSVCLRRIQLSGQMFKKKSHKSNSYRENFVTLGLFRVQKLPKFFSIVEILRIPTCVLSGVGR